MGLLDGILGNVLGGMTGAGRPRGYPQPADDNPLGSVLGRVAGSGIAKAALLGLVLHLIQKNGGIGGLVDRLRNGGLGRQADSWVGTGQNLHVAPDQLRDALGPGVLDQLARQFGMSEAQASESVSQVLPELVNQMTPDGSVPDNDYSEISDALSQLQPHYERNG